MTTEATYAMSEESGLSSSQVVYIVVGIVTSLFILIPNILVLIAVRISRRVRKVSYIYLTSLSIIDLLAGSLALPAAIVTHLNLSYDYLNMSCRAMEYFLRMVESVGVFNLVLIAHDRYKVIVYRPLGVYTTRRQTLVSIAAVWIFGVLYAIRSPFQYKMKMIMDGYGTDKFECVIIHYGAHDSWEILEKYLLLLDFFLLFSVPLVLMMCFYFIIIVEIRPKTNSLVRNASNRHMTVFKTVVVLITMFVMFTLPLYALDLYIYFGPGPFKGEHEVRAILEVISLCFYGVNAITYALYWPVYRRTLASLFRIHLDEASQSEDSDDYHSTIPQQQGRFDIPVMGMPTRKSTSDLLDGDSGVVDQDRGDGNGGYIDSPSESPVPPPKLGIPGHGKPDLGIPGFGIDGLPGMRSGALEEPEYLSIPSVPQTDYPPYQDPYPSAPPSRRGSIKSNRSRRSSRSRRAVFTIGGLDEGEDLSSLSRSSSSMSLSHLVRSTHALARKPGWGNLLINPDKTRILELELESEYHRSNVHEIPAIFTTPAITLTTADGRGDRHNHLLAPDGSAFNGISHHGSGRQSEDSGHHGDNISLSPSQSTCYMLQPSQTVSMNHSQSSWIPCIPGTPRNRTYSWGNLSHWARGVERELMEELAVRKAEMGHRRSSEQELGSPKEHSAPRRVETVARF